MSVQFYDRQKAEQQERIAAKPDMKVQRDTVLKLLGLKTGDSVLDVGSGSGIFAREMFEVVGDSGHVCGIDSSSPMIEIVKKNCPEGVFLQGDATALPLEDASFDFVTTSQLLCFIADVEQAVCELYRALKPGGRVVILDSDWASLVWNCNDQALMDRAIKLLASPYANSHVPRTLSRHLKAAGFNVTDRQTLTILNWEPDPESYSQHTTEFIKTMMETSTEFTSDDWETWIADQNAIISSGDYMFSLNRYIFCATKPR